MFLEIAKCVSMTQAHFRRRTLHTSAEPNAIINELNKNLRSFRLRNQFQLTCSEISQCCKMQHFVPKITFVFVLAHFLCIYPRANGAKRRSGRKPGARVTNSALAFTYIWIMRCYIAQWHSGIKSHPIRHFLCHGRW